MESKMLKPYKGMDIEKSYELNADNTIKKIVLFIQHTIVIVIYLTRQKHFHSWKEKLTIYTDK